MRFVVTVPIITNKFADRLCKSFNTIAYSLLTLCKLLASYPEVFVCQGLRLS